MKKLLDELLAAEREAQALLAKAQAEAEEKRRAASQEIEALRREERAAADKRRTEALEAARKQAAEEEHRIAVAVDNEIAAIKRRFGERRETLAATMASTVLPKTL